MPVMIVDSRLSFVSGKSQLAKLIRDKNWGDTPLGSIELWPQSLKTVVGVMLENRFPMYIVWGTEFIQLYNDAYVSILTEQKHPNALGQPSAVTWPDIWSTIGQMYRQVVESGEAVGFDNFFLPHIRNGKWEDAFFSFSYNPIRDETGGVGGILVVCEETTQKVLGETRLQEIRDANIANEKEAARRLSFEKLKLEAIFRDSPAAMALWRGPDSIFEMVNPQFQDLFPGRQLIGKPYVEALPETKSQVFPQLLKKVYETGENFSAQGMRAVLARRAENILEENYFDFTYIRVLDAEGAPYGVYCHAIDVTENMTSRQASEIKTQALELTLKEAPLPEVLELIVNLFESKVADGTLASILLLDSTGQKLLHGAAPSLPAEYNQAVHGLTIGPNIGSCGTAAFQARQIIVADISTDPLWENHRDLALKNNLLSCWSTPIISSRGKVLGTFALYHSVRGSPALRDQQLVELASQASAIVIERHYEISRRKTAEAAVREASREISDVLESMSDAFLTVEENWMVSRVNAQFEKVIHMKRQDVVGKSLIDLYFTTPEQKESMYIKVYAQVMSDKKPASFVDYYEPFNIWTAVNVYPKSGGGLAIFFREISEEKKAAQKLEKAVSSRDEFLSIASHELRTPITAMKLQVQMMEKSLAKQDPQALSPTRVERLVKQTRKGLDRMNRLVEDMLDISRIQAGKLALQFEEVDLVALVHELADRFLDQLSAAEIPLQVKTDAPKILIEADHFRIEQVITNLITNAIRYAPKTAVIITLESPHPPILRSPLGSPAVIEPSVSPVPKTFVTLHFRDHGPGIGEADRERVFERFERLISAYEVSGFGLGLYIVKQIILTHHGTIQVDGTVTTGASFVIQLPIRQDY